MSDELRNTKQRASNAGRRRSTGRKGNVDFDAAIASKARRRKVRTGCKTCKVRRLKCDETRPACTRCTSTGRMCDGYGNLTIPSLPFDIQGSDEERRGYHYFRLKTAPSILGSQDAAYWTSALLQLSYSQPAIKHALIAMASIHEALEATGWYLDVLANDRGRSLRMLSWKQYNHAIQNILRETALNRMPFEILMILCLLFNQYENFQCDYTAAYTHIQSGLKLLNQWSAPAQTPGTPATPASESTVTTVDMVNEHVKPMLTRLDVQASLLMHSDAHAPPYTVLAMTNPPNIPLAFESFSQARQMFDHATSWMYHNLGKGKDHCDSAKKAEMKDMYEQWWMAFGSLVGRSPVRLGSEEDRAARLLRVYYNFARIILDTHHDLDEMGFDQHTERFDAMVQQAQDLVQPPFQKEDRPSQPFSFDVSLASPLNFVAARCRVPHIRRQAISILKSAMKSSWNCEHCACVAQYLLEVEEADIAEITHCRDIPSEKRIRRIQNEVNFEEGHMQLSYVHFPYTIETPINVAIIPLKKSRTPSTDGSHEIPPVVSGLQLLHPTEEGETTENTSSADEKSSTN